MKKILILCLLLSSFATIYSEEYVDLPLSVILEEDESEFQMDDIEEDPGPVEETVIEKYFNPQTESNENYTTTPARRTSAKPKTIRRKAEIEQYSKIVVKAGFNLGSTNTLTNTEPDPNDNTKTITKDYEADFGFGVNGGAEYIRTLGFINGLEVGAGGCAELIAWDNIEYDLTNIPDGMDLGDPGFISIPLYGLIRYNYRNDGVLNGAYTGLRLGFNMPLAAGSLQAAGGGMYYGFVFGKDFGNFSGELVYAGTSGTVEMINYADSTTDGSTTTYNSIKRDFSLSKISINFGYSFDL